MKFSKLSQLFLVSTIGLLVATLLTACNIVTIDYVFVATSSSTGSNSSGSIETYAVDSQSGALRTGEASVSSGGAGPIALATTSDYEHLYVANQTSKNIVHFDISMNGVLSAKQTISLSDAPVAVTVNQAGTYLYVLSGTTSATLTEYSLSSGVIGSVVSRQSLSLSGISSAYAKDVLVPTGVVVLTDGNAVYATAYDQSAYNPGGTTTCTSGCANPGWVFGFIVGSGGKLTASTNSPYEAGVKPSGIVATTTSSNIYVYVTDYASSELIGYSVLDGTTLRYLTGGPFKTGNEPSAITIDPRGKFLYVSNWLDSTVSAYSINMGNGAPTSAVSTTGTSTNSTNTEPVAIAVDPALGRFVYTANYLDNSISGFRLDSTSGALTSTQATPYPTGQTPTAIAIIPHGNHASQTNP
jgi:6-phosphogluconolactonase (cycloisomerase 2 family)